MSNFGPRALDDAVERRWPRLMRWQDPAAEAQASLTLSLVFQLTALTLVLLGPPYSYGAGGVIGGTIGLLIASLRSHRRQKLTRG